PAVTRPTSTRTPFGALRIPSPKDLLHAKALAAMEKEKGAFPKHLPLRERMGRCLMLKAAIKVIAFEPFIKECEAYNNRLRKEADMATTKTPIGANGAPTDARTKPMEAVKTPMDAISMTTDASKTTVDAESAQLSHRRRHLRLLPQ
ncbi:hypothetical protein PFISCL1PPCAC_17911, partial [Pristionchus fissidentatus]